MTDKAGGRLLDLGRGRDLGEVSAEDLAFLRSRLVSEDPGDVDFYLTRETLEGLKGGSPPPPQKLMQLLSIAMGPDDELDLGLCVTQGDKPLRVRGRVTGPDGPAPGVKVAAYDRDVMADDFLGSALTGPDGCFVIGFSPEDFGGAIEGRVELVLVLSVFKDGQFAEARRVPFDPSSQPDRDIGDLSL